jgi:hypothetical protein
MARVDIRMHRGTVGVVVITRMEVDTQSRSNDGAPLTICLVLE